MLGSDGVGLEADSVADVTILSQQSEFDVVLGVEPTYENPLQLLDFLFCGYLTILKAVPS